jgi:hypothetical protein
MRAHAIDVHLQVSHLGGGYYKMQWQQELGRGYLPQTSTNVAAGWWSNVWNDYQTAFQPNSEAYVNNSSQNPGFRVLYSDALRWGFSSMMLPISDDDESTEADLGFVHGINFAGESDRQTVWVNQNGNVTFQPFSQFTPESITQPESLNGPPPMFAPFWADVDPRVGEPVRYGQGTVGTHRAFGVTWRDVAYYKKHDDKRCTFQLVLIEREDVAPGDFDVEFNYGRMGWEAGDVSGGANGYGRGALAGIATGPMSRIELEGTLIPGAFLDERTDSGTISPLKLISRKRGSDVLGRVVFQVRNGQVEHSLVVNAGLDQSNPIENSMFSLSGTAYDPSVGNFNGAGVTVEWRWREVFFGSSSMKFANRNTLTPTAWAEEGVQALFLVELKARSTVDPTITATATMFCNYERGD